MNCSSIVRNWYVSNRVRNYPRAFFLTVRAGTAYRHLFHVAGTDIDMCKSFNFKKRYTKVPQIAERFEPNTLLWAFHTIQPSSVLSL